MKYGLVALSAVFFNFFTHAGVTSPSPVEDIFIPNGFDNNDNVEIVVTGKFPNPCFGRTITSVDYKDDKIFITLTTEHKSNSEKLCDPLKVPFSEVIQLGSLQGGDYEVVVNNELREKLFIDSSHSQSVDDHLYAPVEYVDLGFTGGISGDATIIAKSISSCLAIDHVEYLSNGKNTFSILPIMKKVSPDCPEQNERLEIPIQFDLSKLKAEKVLLFVRSLDGKSIHTLIERDK